MLNMTNEARTDIHSPTNLVTEDYEFVDAIDTHPEYPDDHYRWVLNRLTQLVQSSPVKRGLTQCHHCGSHLRYVAVLEHQPTGQHIAVGETCLDNRFGKATAEFHKLRKQAQLDREKQRIQADIAAFVEVNPDLAWMADTDTKTWPWASTENEFVDDVARKLRRYGSLSERQIDAIRKAVERDTANAEAEAERDSAEAEKVRLPVPTGRVDIEGQIVGIKVVYNDFGSSVKMMVEGDDGWKVWATLPSAIDDADRGDRIKVRLTITAADDDETFGFGKRPSNAELLEVADDE